MILTGEEIRRQVRDGQITVDPFDDSALNPNSIDVRLGASLVEYVDDILDPAESPNVRWTEIPDSGMVLPAGGFLLGATIERIGSDCFVPVLHGKSSTARAGLFVHVTADLIDLGSHGQLTLQLHSRLPVRVYPGMRIAQVSFWRPVGAIELYTGKYQGSVGPQPSRIHEDWSVG